MLKEVSEKDQKNNYKAKQGSAEAEINSNTVKKTNKQTRICSGRNLL